MTRITHLIGIDPDSDKSGVCFYERLSKAFSLYNLRFFDLLDFLIAEKSKGMSFEVVIEAGWHNKSNWHIKADDSPKKAAKIGG